MPTVRIPIEIAWTGASGSPGQNIWHARVDSLADPNPDVQSMADMLETFYSAMSGSYTTTTTIRFLGEATGVGDDAGDFFTADPWTVAGDGAGGFFPPSQCLLVQWRTSSGGRRGRGRTFIGPLNDGLDEGNGTPDEGVRSGVQAAIDALIEDSDSFGNGALGIYSRVEDTFRDLTSGSCANYFAVLRSRRD